MQRRGTASKKEFVFRTVVLYYPVDSMGEKPMSKSIKRRTDEKQQFNKNYSKVSNDAQNTPG